MEASAVPRAAPIGVTGVASPQLLRLASDARLVVLVRQGWPAAFEAVYNRHHRGILSFCRHVLSDADEAEDAVQHTFLAAYNDLIGSDKPIHLRAWLFTIARNRCYSILRARREQPSADLDEPVTEGLATQVQRRQDLRDLVVDLRGLPDEQRAALVLAELDALSHEEIGEALGVPREKVKALVFQARESLVASRTARETACADIREQLSNGRGGALRRANLRRHLRDCSGCRDFRRQVERQRRQIAALLPVVPTLALKEAVLTGSVGFGGSGLLASSALKSGLFKGFATLMLATAGTAGTYVATHDFHTRTNFRGAARPHLVATPEPVSTPGLAPTVHRRLAPARSHDHTGSVAAPELRRLGAVRLTTPARAGHVLNPFGPLVHSRFPFPRKHISRRQTIAPPKSTGKAPTPVPSAPLTIASVPTATITSSPVPALVESNPVTDRPSSTGALPAPSTRGAGSPHSVGRSAGRSTRTGAAGGRVSQAALPSRGSSVRAAGQPAGRSAPRGGDDGRVHGKSVGLPGGKPVVPDGKPRGTTRPADTAPGSGDAGTTTGPPAVGDGRLPSSTTMAPGSTIVSTGGSGGDPSGGTGGRGGSSVSPGAPAGGQ